MIQFRIRCRRINRNISTGIMIMSMIIATIIMMNAIMTIVTMIMMNAIMTIAAILMMRVIMSIPMTD